MPKKLVILTGAGISAESGLKTFRDSDGLWNGYNIEDVATPEAWMKNPELVLNFYNQRRKDVIAAQPNAAHYGLKDLENYFDVQIITQNIDDLHERAGSKNVLHLHGEILKMRSVGAEEKIYPVYTNMFLGQVDDEGFQLRPHIVWFGEPVPMIEPAIQLAKSADIFVVIGTSLLVYPAAGLVHYIQPNTPLFVLDRKIPNLSSTSSIYTIEKSATEGIGTLKDQLLSLV